MHLVGGDKYGLAFTLQLPDEVFNEMGVGRIHPGSRLVEEKNLRIMLQCPNKN